MMAQSTNISNNEPMQIMAKLKDRTKYYHAKLESLPYFRTLIDHKLPLDCYVGQLRALAIIHGVMEKEIAASENKLVAAVWDERLKKLPLLEMDLEFFEPRVILDIPFAIEKAIAMTAKIRIRRLERPATLLGYLYVFEGSTLGNSLHNPDVSATFHLNNFDGCHYYSSYKDQLQSSWKLFLEKMNGALDDISLHDPIIEASQEAFDGLEELYSALYPPKRDNKSYHVTRINPEAGNHPIPDDEREIQAALIASARGWAEFPYYESRYGKRGKPFSDSDTCWLAALVNLDQEGIQKQIDWLGRVLASRGMPQIMLEQTLRFLHEELVKSVPDKETAYGKLLKAAEVLSEKRLEHISEKDFQILSNEFEDAVGFELANKYKNVGKLLVASVVDEKSGIEGSVSALQEWMNDNNRFSERWILAVNDIIMKSKQLCI
ncbi:MAG: biliverdin-producing heme oxygenase [Syntrophobacteraceae bacterium]